jgi:hypothetical protein
MSAPNTNASCFCRSLKKTAHPGAALAVGDVGNLLNALNSGIEIEVTVVVVPVSLSVL